MPRDPSILAEQPGGVLHGQTTVAPSAQFGRSQTELPNTLLDPLLDRARQFLGVDALAGAETAEGGTAARQTAATGRTTFPQAQGLGAATLPSVELPPIGGPSSAAGTGQLPAAPQDTETGGGLDLMSLISTASKALGKFDGTRTAQATTAPSGTFSGSPTSFEAANAASERVLGGAPGPSSFGDVDPTLYDIQRSQPGATLPPLREPASRTFEDAIAGTSQGRGAPPAAAAPPIGSSAAAGGNPSASPIPAGQGPEQASAGSPPPQSGGGLDLSRIGSGLQGAMNVAQAFLSDRAPTDQRILQGLGGATQLYGATGLSGASYAPYVGTALGIAGTAMSDMPNEQKATNAAIQAGALALAYPTGGISLAAAPIVQGIVNALFGKPKLSHRQREAIDVNQRSGWLQSYVDNVLSGANTPQALWESLNMLGGTEGSRYGHPTVALSDRGDLRDLTWDQAVQSLGSGNTLTGTANFGVDQTSRDQLGSYFANNLLNQMSLIYGAQQGDPTATAELNRRVAAKAERDAAMAELARARGYGNPAQYEMQAESVPGSSATYAGRLTTDQLRQVLAGIPGEEARMQDDLRFGGA